MINDSKPMINIYRILSFDSGILIIHSAMARTSRGQAFTQIPQAMHFDVAGMSFVLAITPLGQTRLHLPQPMQTFLLII